MLEADELSPVARMRPALAPKALIHQKFGNQASYRIEEVRQPLENNCPGLALAQQTRSLYRCYLDLPELSVISDAVPKKKDAEHAAAKIAIEKLGIQSKVDNLTPREAMDELVLRLAGFFTDEFLSSNHPLVGHIKFALSRVGERFGMIPMSVIATCDTKVNNLCKFINPKAESEPLLVLLLILRAAKMSASICITYGEFWIWKQGSYPTEFVESVKNLTSVSTQKSSVEAIFIPCLHDRDVETLTLHFSDSLYYLDEIAQKLHVRDPSRILVSRTVGKASSEIRLYFSAPDVPFLTSDSSMEVPMIEGNVNLDKILNERASYLSGQCIYGNAIMAHVGYTWKSSNLFFEDIWLSTYYRMILGKLPDGHYKLSREAILSAELPAVYTTRSNWKGPTPRDLLCVFCRQHRLLDPLFSIKTLDHTEISVESCEVQKESKLSRSADEVEKVNGDKSDPIRRELGRSISAFQCEVKILSKRQDPVFKCSFDDTCRKECDAIQSAALKVLSCFNKYFKQPDMPIEKFFELENGHSIAVYSKEFIQELVKCPSIYDIKRKNKSSGLHISSNQRSTQYENGISCKIDGPDSGIFPSPGSVICISYVVVLMDKDTTLKEVLESKDSFEFEIGTGAVISELESCVSQLTVNQSAKFVVEVPSRDLIFSAAGQAATHLSQLSLNNYFLEYSVKLLDVTEPLEDRIEQALFSPPLSKQRVEFAVWYINQLHATSLVDFGCGSGSLLDSLLDHTTTLEKVAGVDISRKSLIRAAKILHLKLSANLSRQKSIRSTILYDGSITDFDSRLREFDIGTCLEVIEHMEEDQACLFGDIVLSFFCPGVLIVSTPNFEYNPILQRSSMPGREDSEDKPTSIKFRNHDHKFEWTRQQFQHWANNLAVRHNYSVEFSGVGGSADTEPGFASQIAVFKRSSNLFQKQCLRTEPSELYEVIWEWSADSAPL
ncbi:hypothetical protein KFK09_022011 [Dendrobium nobile]|uniref:Small RNA 2'-O-methyltransferase n=1 Tax=Dendrobium nobile TaxID=94219 RepID=A0A8T3AHS4_DENNO|nr:hypothetical protein KFK09_022011 [Dendrobium nobile]